MCLEGVWAEVGFTLALFQGWDGGSEVLLEQVQLNFSFRNKFIIVFPCCLLVDSNTFLKMCFLKVFLSAVMMVVMKTEMHILIIIIKSKTMKSLYWLF